MTAPKSGERYWSRDDARQAGAIRFFTGEPCRRGHIAERFVKDCKCLECNRLKAAKYRDGGYDHAGYQRAHRLKNGEHHRARDRQSYHTRPEVRASKITRAMQWEAENRERKSAAHRAWRAANMDYIRRRSKEWRDANPDLCRALYHKRRARKLGAEGFYASDDIDRIKKAQKGKCAYCRCGLKKGKTHIDHIIPLILGGSNWPHNLQLTCESCNSSKGRRDPITFAQSRGLLL